jgi:hypothetical protein
LRFGLFLRRSHDGFDRGRDGFAAIGGCGVNLTILGFDGSLGGVCGIASTGCAAGCGAG